MRRSLITKVIDTVLGFVCAVVLAVMCIIVYGVYTDCPDAVGYQYCEPEDR